ncbi:MAG: oligoendopeptidase F, partial [Anaerolineae bacterium]|nr:oligoendopeptidase F [Anaerolineae bacterium]
MTQTLPHWDLSNVYPGLESPEFGAAMADFAAQLDELEALFADRIAGTDAATPLPTLSGLVGEAIDRFNAASELADTLRPYIVSFVATDSRNTLARRRLSEFELVAVRLRKLGTRFEAWIGRLAPVLEDVIAANATAAAHAFALREAAEQSRYLMSEAEEALAAELSLSGAS